MSENLARKIEDWDAPSLPESAEAEQNVTNIDRAVDALAASLRVAGKFAFDLPETDAVQIAAFYETWAQHVLYATPPPESVITTVHGRRDWTGLNRFIADHRQKEHTHITQTLSGIRAVIPQMLQGMQDALKGTTAADSQVQARMETLRDAALNGSPETLQREALGVVESVSMILDARRQQHEQQIEMLRSQLQEMNQQLKQARAEGIRDPLTGLENRKAFDTHLTNTMELQQIFQTQACLLAVDADHFKAVNDTYGHAVGDKVLRGIADCLSRTFVSQDDCVARYGGEEFAVILRDASLDDARRLTERLIKSVRAMCVEADGKQVRCTLSVGIAVLQPQETAAAWLARADDALYRAKQEGRDRCIIA